jgi:hypothetical protein
MKTFQKYNPVTVMIKMMIVKNLTTKMAHQTVNGKKILLLGAAQ